MEISTTKNETQDIFLAVDCIEEKAEELFKQLSDCEKDKTNIEVAEKIFFDLAEIASEYEKICDGEANFESDRIYDALLKKAYRFLVQNRTAAKGAATGSSMEMTNSQQTWNKIAAMSVCTAINNFPSKRRAWNDDAKMLRNIIFNRLPDEGQILLEKNKVVSEFQNKEAARKIREASEEFPHMSLKTPQ